MYTISAGIWMPLWATGRERAALITVISVRLGECAGAADKTLISTARSRPVAHSGIHIPAEMVYM